MRQSSRPPTGGASRADQLADAVDTTSGAISEGDLAATVLRQAVTGCEARFGLLAVLDGGELRAAGRFEGPAFHEAAVASSSDGDATVPATGSLGAALRGETVVCESQADHEQRFRGEASWAPAAQASIVVPIAADGAVLGVLAVAWRTAGAVNPANRRLVSALATLAGQGVSRARLAESASLLDALYASDVVGVLSGEGDTIHTANDEFLRIIGRERHVLDGGLTWRALTPPEQMVADDRRIEAVSTGGGAALLKEYLHREGHRVPVLVVGSGVSVEPFRWFSIVLDLSNRDRVRDLVETEAAVITTLLDSAPVGFVVLDRELCCVQVNEWTAELTGMPIRHHRGRRVFDAMPSLEGDLAPLLLQVLDTGEPVRDVETRNIGEGDRRLRDGLVNLFPVTNPSGSTVGVAMVLMDISDRKQLEDELSATAQLLEAVMRSTPVGLAVVDEDGCFVRLNEKLSDIDPLPVDAHVGRRVEDIVPSPAGDRLASWVEAVLRTGEPVLGEELEGVDAGGSEIDVVVHVYPVGDEDEVTGAGIALIDVTERNRLERSTTTTLEQRIAAQDAVLDELQRLLLPELATPSGLEVAARYLPAESHARVGGDWYDCFEHDGRAVLTVGDGVGHGLPAVRVMDAARNTIRALVMSGHDLATTVGHANRVLRRVDVATACLVSVDADSGEVAFVLGGHPPPMVARRDGTVEVLSSPRGTMLGACEASVYTTGRTRLGPGDSLVLYTDGLIERRGESIDNGLDRLAASLRGRDLAPLELVQHVLEQNLADESDDDDVCLLITRRPPHVDPTVSARVR